MIKISKEFFSKLYNAEIVATINKTHYYTIFTEDGCERKLLEGDIISRCKGYVFDRYHYCVHCDKENTCQIGSVVWTSSSELQTLIRVINDLDDGELKDLR